IYNFICEIPKWTRAKFEIATGETFNPIRQDVKNGKLRFYQHGDMMWNYGAFPQTWEDPEYIPEDTKFPGDNDPLDVIELGTRQLPTGSVTAVKVLGVLGLLDSGETDWKVFAINIKDPLANIMHDVHDIDKHMPGCIDAIRDWLRIYKVCTGAVENQYALRGEALNEEYAKNVIEQAHQHWLQLNEEGRREVSKDE
ncbi:acidocalcisomal pyrophosphatase, partial [Reticulomyxa filosa]